MGNRMESGIPGLDEMIEGGFPVPCAVLLAGEPGTGKTTLGVQSLFYGAKRGETTMFITAISEPNWVVQKFLSGFSFFDQSLVDMGRVVFIDVGETLRENPNNVLDVIKDEVERYSPNRFVFDPITVMRIAIADDKKYREFLHDLITYMKAFECVTFLTGEFSYNSISTSVEGYMVDGIIVLSYPKEENARRKYLEVLKMRGTKHLTGEQAVDITKNGFVVQPGLR
ncbi:MAG: ATPase domain-containing protein [Thermoplasmata archaeon]